MKAADIMMWLLVFNLVIWLLGGYGLNIYNLGNYQIDIDTNSINSSRPYSATEETSSRALGFFFDIAGVSFLALIIGVTTAAVMGYLLSAMQTTQGIVYGAFSGIFWGSFIKTSQVFFNIFASFKLDPTIKVTIFLSTFFIFLGISAFVFMFGFMQMVTGGWRFFK
jgi:ABC-type microcin C transport system permease subunit YejE